MALARLTILPAGYEIRTATQCLSLFVSPRGFGFDVAFHGPWREGKKARLIENLIAKQFDPLVPRFRIRLRRTE